ncbi:MAG: hypothetical protein UR28_C0021G0005 [Candidatus Peregrinibacteria bacterium GW2011_GWF2_33_10]|nr:MAG: hypothetical protein UR28_C0021G0005 [Candidatus Peregrinibacteria bacterium GW2011_GWF2_33_10]OGJ44104.1 MAG: hypothetical protein A2272_00355 [Candidatus Peregrinibacteria bacterium RIFOXYA12_FULL_33_12]OGJ44383.1 MAG: hypothetical protein A2263_05845 [Candidatus Peregrinibacteria bacterium RIFOXYA2_FULL_33_21]OGJ50178.1 MAG: hypothetical protein A2307_03335 [Candidatus Peregrinibacteria bacterium RIFOXYB2_FULL_33_20]
MKTNMGKTIVQLSVVIAMIVAALGVGYAFSNPALAADATSVINANDQIFQTSSGGSVRTLIQTILNFVLGFLGLVAVGYLIYGGFLVLTGGAEDAIEKGKTVMKNAVIGIVIIVVSFAVVNTLISGLATGTEAA